MHLPRSQQLSSSSASTIYGNLGKTDYQGPHQHQHTPTHPNYSGISYSATVNALWLLKTLRSSGLRLQHRPVRTSAPHHTFLPHQNRFKKKRHVCIEILHLSLVALLRDLVSLCPGKHCQRVETRSDNHKSVRYPPQPHVATPHRQHIAPPQERATSLIPGHNHAIWAAAGRGYFRSGQNNSWRSHKIQKRQLQAFDAS